jgi:CBS domain-containing protein
MRIDRLASAISARLVAVAPNDTIRTAAAALTTPDAGLLVVCDEAGRATGVLSKSDLVRHLAVAPSAQTPLAPLVSRNVVHCAPGDDLHETWQKMTAWRIQNMPVLAPDRTPLGVLDIRDALEELLKQEQYLEHLLADYVSGVGSRCGSREALEGSDRRPSRPTRHFMKSPQPSLRVGTGRRGGPAIG